MTIRHNIAHTRVSQPEIHLPIDGSGYEPSSLTLDHGWQPSSKGAALRSERPEKLMQCRDAEQVQAIDNRCLPDIRVHCLYAQCGGMLWHQSRDCSSSRWGCASFCGLATGYTNHASGRGGTRRGTHQQPSVTRKARAALAPCAGVRSVRQMRHLGAPCGPQSRPLRPGTGARQRRGCRQPPRNMPAVAARRSAVPGRQHLQLPGRWSRPHRVAAPSHRHQALPAEDRGSTKECGPLQCFLTENTAQHRQ